MMAVNLSAVLISVFLYQNGYSVLFIAGYWACYYALKALLCLPAARYVAYFGPKHATILSNFLYVPAMAIFAFVPQWGIAAMVFTAILQAMSTVSYDLSYLIHFSKVKSVSHAGREIAYMNMFEKIATGLSPLIGGLLAYAAGPQATLWAASLLFIAASIPLFFSPEPTKLRRKLLIRGFPWRTTWRSMVAETGRGFDVVATGVIWSLLVAIAVLGVTGDDVYAKLGMLLTTTLLVALAASFMFGKLIDNRRGGELLRYSVFAKSLTHIIRPFVGTMGGVAGMNAAHEVATTGYAMAFTRGLFDTADLSGHRIMYLGFVSVMSNVGALAACLVLAALVMLTGDGVTGMQAFFFVAAGAVLIIATPNFHLYRK